MPSIMNDDDIEDRLIEWGLWSRNHALNLGYGKSPWQMMIDGGIAANNGSFIPYTPSNPRIEEMDMIIGKLKIRNPNEFRVITVKYLAHPGTSPIMMSSIAKMSYARFRELINVGKKIILGYMEGIKMSQEMNLKIAA